MRTPVQLTDTHVVAADFVGVSSVERLNIRVLQNHIVGATFDDAGGRNLKLDRKGFENFEGLLK